MKQKTRIASKLFAALVVLTLISCCFLGTTFARYTSSGSGAAQVEVALWDVDFTPGGKSTTIDFGVISPSEQGYAAEGGTAQDATNKLPGQTMVTITNNSEVEADITVVVTDRDYTFVSGAATAFGTTEAAWSEGKLSGAPTKAQVDGILALSVSVTASDSGVNITTSTNAETGAKTYTFTLPAASTDTTSPTVTIAADLTWKTAYSGSDTNGAFEDALDTWIGENIASLSISVSYTAVQGSVLPKPSTP